MLPLHLRLLRQLDMVLWLSQELAVQWDNTTGTLAVPSPNGSKSQWLEPAGQRTTGALGCAAGRTGPGGLTSALQRQFGQWLFDNQIREQQLVDQNYRRIESELHLNVQLYAQQSYPRLRPAAREELALHAFLWDSWERLRQYVRLAPPKSLDEGPAQGAVAGFSTSSP